MGNLFSFTPTFTQGLVVGQMSILFLLSLILKYMFLVSQSEPQHEASSYVPPATEKDRRVPNSKVPPQVAERQREEILPESAEWFNILLQQVVETYRSKLRDDRQGPEGDEIARSRIERYVNKLRPPGFIDPIEISSVDVGSSAPQISCVRTVGLEGVQQAEVDMTYTDTISISLSSSVLFNYPMLYFARLPVSLTISLALFSSTLRLIPPNPLSPDPTLTISLLPTFTLNLQTTSLMGSRAKLADVPKLHEMIHSQIRRVLIEQGTWNVVMPGVASVERVKETLIEK